MTPSIAARSAGSTTPRSTLTETTFPTQNSFRTVTPSIVETASTTGPSVASESARRAVASTWPAVIAESPISRSTVSNATTVPSRSVSSSETIASVSVERSTPDPSASSVSSFSSSGASGCAAAVAAPTATESITTAVRSNTRAWLRGVRSPLICSCPHLCTATDVV